MQGGVGMGIESTRFHRMNVVRCNSTTVKLTTHIGTYIPPSTLEHLPYLTEALTRFRYQYPIVLVDLNADIQY